MKNALITKIIQNEAKKSYVIHFKQKTTAQSLSSKAPGGNKNTEQMSAGGSDSYLLLTPAF